MRPDARRYEFWEKNYAGELAFGAAVDYHLEVDGFDGLIGDRVNQLASRLREAAAAIRGVELCDLRGDPTPEFPSGQCGIVTMDVRALGGADAVKEELMSHGTAVSVSPPSSTLLDSRRRSLPPLLRVSPHYFNSDQDVDNIVGLLKSYSEYVIG